MNALERFLSLSLRISFETGIRYALVAGLAWAVAYLVFRRRWWHRKIVPRVPEGREIGREMLHSAITVLVFGAVGAATYLMIRAGWTQMYFKLGRHSGWWFAGSVALTIALHDTYFYWTHRLMHHRRLFRLFHRTHHLSTNPTPWAAYAFSPLEAVVQAGIFPLAVLLVPIHPLGFLVFMVWQITFNVLGHTGYEFHPKWLLDSWLGSLLNTPTNHVMHHEHRRGNYGLYFNLWDRLMGTNHENYAARFREVTSRVRAGADAGRALRSPSRADDRGTASARQAVGEHAGDAL